MNEYQMLLSLNRRGVPTEYLKSELKANGHTEVSANEWIGVYMRFSENGMSFNNLRDLIESRYGKSWHSL